MINSTVQKMGKRSSYPLPPSMTLISAQAGIHGGSGSAPPTDLPDYVSLSLEKSRSFYSISQTRDNSLGKIARSSQETILFLPG
jgi:hypothetical protein